MVTSHIIYAGSTSSSLVTLGAVRMGPPAPIPMVASVAASPADTISEGLGDIRDARQAEALPMVKSDPLASRQRRATSHKQLNRLQNCLATVLGFVTVVLAATMTVIIRSL